MRTLILVIKVSKHAHCTHCAVLVLADSEKLCMWLRGFKFGNALWAQLNHNPKH